MSLPHDRVSFLDFRRFVRDFRLLTLISMQEVADVTKSTIGVENTTNLLVRSPVLDWWLLVQWVGRLVVVPRLHARLLAAGAVGWSTGGCWCSGSVDWWVLVQCVLFQCVR